MMRLKCAAEYTEAVRLAIWVAARSARQASPSSASARKTPVRGCLPWRAAVRTRACASYIQILYLPRRSLATPMRCRAHLTSPPLLPTDPRSYPEATAIPHRDCTLATTPRRRQCPHRAARPGAACRKREGRAARVATDAVTVAIAVALTGRWRARFACMSITRPAVIYGRSASGTDTLAETGQSLGTTWGRQGLEASYVIYCSCAKSIFWSSI